MVLFLLKIPDSYAAVVHFFQVLINRNRYYYVRERVFLPSFFLLRFEEAAPQECSVKKVFLQISQNSQKNTCARGYFLMKLQA